MLVTTSKRQYLTSDMPRAAMAFDRDMLSFDFLIIIVVSFIYFHQPTYFLDKNIL